jgi:hypothetical protein
MSKLIAAAAAAASALLVPVSAGRAGVVRPGETVVVSDLDLTMPEGAVLAQSVLPFALTYEPSGGGSLLDFDGTVGGTLTSTVVREAATGTLAFVYDVDFSGDAGADASEASVLTVGGFGAFATDVTGALDFESVILASRAEDAGSAVQLSSDDPGLGGAPKLVVRTDATAFAATGTARFFAGDELAVLTPDGLSLEVAAGTAEVAGIFQPAADDGTGGGGATPIPLPPAALIGLATMAFAGAARRRSLRRAPGR